MRYIVDKKMTEVYTEIVVESYRRESCPNENYEDTYNKLKSNINGIEITNIRKSTRTIFESLGIYDMIEGKAINNKVGKIIPIHVQILIKVLLLEIGPTNKKGGLYSKIKNKRFGEITNEDYEILKNAIIVEYVNWSEFLEYPDKGEGHEKNKAECDLEFADMLENFELDAISEENYGENEKSKYKYLKNKLMIYESLTLLLNEFLPRLEYLSKTEIYRNLIVESINDKLKENMVNELSEMHKAFIQRPYTIRDSNISIELVESIMPESGSLPLSYLEKFILNQMYLSNSHQQLRKYDIVSQRCKEHKKWMFELLHDEIIFVEIPRVPLLYLTEILYENNMKLNKEEYGNLLQEVFVEERVNELHELTYKYEKSLEAFPYEEVVNFEFDVATLKRKIKNYIEEFKENHYIE